MKDDKPVENDVTFTIELGNPVVTNGDFVLASTLTEEHEEVTIGIADAIAHAAMGRIQLRRPALHLPETTCRRAPIPCAYPIVEHDYAPLRPSRSRNATTPLTAYYDSQHNAPPK